jgi:2-desacetyl-2-hydroxyethyl bacteriochlorophyllide A dehydrogenase
MIGAMRAAVVHSLPASELSIEVVEAPTAIGPEDLLVRVSACGICGTDLHILAGHSYQPAMPFVLGHEPVGIVVEGGGPAGERWLGRRVTLTLFTGCGQCHVCKHGQERICSNLRSITGVLAAWGGYAEYMVIRAAQAVDVPESLSDLEVACLVDGGTTAANAVRVALDYSPRHVAVVGAGPIGFIAAEMLRDQRVDVEVVQSSDPRRSMIRAAGYPTVASLRELTAVPDVIIDCSGDPDVTAGSMEALAPGGIYIAAGYATVPSFELAHVARKELTLRGVRSGSRADLVNVMNLAATGRIRLPPIKVWPLTEINDAFAALREKRVDGKAVISPMDSAQLVI